MTTLPQLDHPMALLLLVFVRVLFLKLTRVICYSDKNAVLLKEKPRILRNKIQRLTCAISLTHKETNKYFKKSTPHF